jgi:hypothetical protein
MFKHYLDFKDLPLIGRIEISEPFKFDGSTFEVKREKGRHSRDVMIANQDIELEIQREHFELLDTDQVLPDGTIFNLASHGFDYLLNEINTRGWEMSVEYIINYNGTDFTTGEIDGLTYKVNDNELSFKVTQNTLHSYIKKNDSVKIDAFSDKSLTGLPITPCDTHDIFLKAKPLLQFSSWESQGDEVQGIAFRTHDTFIKLGANNSNVVNNFGVENTLSFFSTRYAINGAEFPTDGLSYTYLEAKSDLSNIKVEITDLIAYSSQLRANIGTSIITSANGVVRLYLKYGFDDGYGADLETIVLYEKTFTNTSSTPIEFFPTEVSANIPSMQQGMRLWIYIACDITNFNVSDTLNDSFYQVNGVMQEMKVSITATSTAISTIVKGIRLYDLLRHQAHSYDTTLNDLGVFNNTSEYWNNFVFNGRMLGNLSNQAFNNEFKDTYASVCDEAFADYQITNNGIEIDFINNYYKDTEIANFTELPSNEYNYTANSDYSINLFNVKFKKSSSDRTGNQDGTNDDVHTSLQLKMPSKKADAIYNLEFNHIRSAQLIEEQRRKGNQIDGKTRTLENDENLFILDCVELAPNTENTFTQFLRYRILEDTNALEIVSNGTFVWTNLGMQVGQTISVSFSGLPLGTNFIITALEDFTIRLSYVNNFPTSNSNGEKSITFTYVLQGVQYTNRTNQGFTTINGVANPDNYSNLKYSLKRITNKWLKFINTAGQYLIGKDANVTEIKINNELITRMTGESADVIDFAPIEITEDRILNGRVFSAKVFCDFDTANELFTEVRDLKGYVRIILNSGNIVKGFIKDARYTWRSQELILTLEEKQDNLITELNTLNIFNYNIVNNFVNLYDSNNNLLLNPKEYQFFSINGVIYDNVDDFTNNLIPLLNE